MLVDEIFDGLVHHHLHPFFYLSSVVAILFSIVSLSASLLDENASLTTEKKPAFFFRCAHHYYTFGRGTGVELLIQYGFPLALALAVWSLSTVHCPFCGRHCCWLQSRCPRASIYVPDARAPASLS